MTVGRYRPSIAADPVSSEDAIKAVCKYLRNMIDVLENGKDEEKVKLLHVFVEEDFRLIKYCRDNFIRSLLRSGVLYQWIIDHSGMSGATITKITRQKTTL